MNQTIALSTPVKIDGVETDTLVMREPSVEDMLAVKKGKGSAEDQELSLFANLCEVGPETIRALKFRDYRRIQKAFAALTEDEEEASPLE